MNTAFKIRLLVYITIALMVSLAVVAYVYGSTSGNMKFDLTPEGRAVISCIDKSAPTVRVVARPDSKSGVYAVISCEKEK